MEYINTTFIFVMSFLVNAMVSKICIINFLKIIHKKYPKIYKNFGEPSLAFSDIGRDQIITWYILTKKFAYRDLNILKFILAVSTFIFILFFILTLVGYIGFMFF